MRTAGSSLYTDGLVEQTVNHLVRMGHTYEQDGALWLRSTDYGDDKDRVMRKSDGTYTYTEFEDNDCSRVSAAISSKWYVWDGTLVVEFPEGKSLKDEIVNMAPKKMVLRSVEDSLVYHRVRSEKCSTASIKAKPASGRPPLARPEPTWPARRSCGRLDGRCAPRSPCSRPAPQCVRRPDGPGRCRRGAGPRTR